MLLDHAAGHYRFLRGIDPYSCGVVTIHGYEIVHLTLRHPRPWREGFDLIRTHIEQGGQTIHALCAIALRSPAPFTMAGFVAFNQGYCQLLEAWGLYVDGVNPIARTNVAPVESPPGEPALYSFAYTRPCPGKREPCLLVAGAGELREGFLEEARILQRGRTDPDALQEKAAYVLQVMEERVSGLGGRWAQIARVNVYTAHPIDSLAPTIRQRVGGSARHGLCWHNARPPVEEIEFEMDVRGVRTEVWW